MKEKTALKITTSDKTPIEKLTDVMSYLYSHEDGCSWTRAQTHQTLVPYLIEESYETADTIDQGKTGDDLRDELGDILLQVVYHAEIAKARGAFSFQDVAQTIVDKLVRRYPTILGDEPNTLKTPEEIDRRWNEIKAEERRKKGILPQDESVMDGVSQGLPSLVRATKLKDRASKAGWEWPNTSMLLGKIAEEVGELKAECEAQNPDKERIAAEFGDLLFMMADFARHYGFDAEDALRTTNNRVEKRFRHMEKRLRQELGKKINQSTVEERVKYWQEAKQLEKDAAK